MEPSWELSAIVGEDGKVDRPSAAAGWILPGRAWIEGDVLRWEDEPIRETWGDSDMLAAFIALADPESDVPAFAERYGVLRLCEHELPASHNPVPPPWLLRSTRTGGCSGLDEEPALIWRIFAAQARAILNIAAAVRAGRPGPERDWSLIYSRSGRAAPWWRQDATIDALKLAQVVNEWLYMGNVRPSLQGRELRMVSTGGLFGALAVRLASAVAVAQAIYLCDGCGQPIDVGNRGRRPQAGRRAFCESCRERGVPAKIRAQVARTNKRGAF